MKKVAVLIGSVCFAFVEGMIPENPNRDKAKRFFSEQLQQDYSQQVPYNMDSVTVDCSAAGRKKIAEIKRAGNKYRRPLEINLNFDFFLQENLEQRHEFKSRAISGINSEQKLNYLLSHLAFDNGNAQEGRAYLKISDDTSDFVGIISDLILENASDSDICDFATNILKIIKNDSKNQLILKGRFYKQSLETASIMLTSERLRAVQAIILSYTELYKLKHDPGRLIETFFNITPISSVLTDSKFREYQQFLLSASNDFNESYKICLDRIEVYLKDEVFDNKKLSPKRLQNCKDKITIPNKDGFWEYAKARYEFEHSKIKKKTRETVQRNAFFAIFCISNFNWASSAFKNPPHDPYLIFASTGGAGAIRKVEADALEKTFIEMLEFSPVYAAYQSLPEDIKTSLADEFYKGKLEKLRFICGEIDSYAPSNFKRYVSAVNGLYKFRLRLTFEHWKEQLNKHHKIMALSPEALSKPEDE
ncbi:MAG: hypothetical protein LBQ08_04230 [Holosporaceae bacterium]|nr:hypothetical protein [Holosporaceae bacterium]